MYAIATMKEMTVEIKRALGADDDANFRRRVRELLASEPDIEVVGEAANGQEAILKARELEPDLVLMDVRMPGINGLEATRRLKDEMSQLDVIILTLFDLDEYRKAATNSGASGYVIKKSLIEALSPTIRETLAANNLDEWSKSNEEKPSPIDRR